MRVYTHNQPSQSHVLNVTLKWEVPVNVLLQDEECFPGELRDSCGSLKG